MPRKPIKRRAVKKPTKPRLGLRVSNALDKLTAHEASQPQATRESIFSIQEQSILRRIRQINSGEVSGFLTETDYLNLKRIAAKHRIKLP